MSAERPMRRRVTAREAAERLGISTRTIQRVIAEPRDEFERRSRERQDRALALRQKGLLWREIADELDVSIGAAQKLGERAKKRQEAETLPPPLFDVESPGG